MIISTTYLFDPDYYSLYWISIIPIVMLAYIVKSGNKSLLPENMILSLICGFIPFIIITTIINKAIVMLVMEICIKMEDLKSMELD